MEIKTTTLEKRPTQKQRVLELLRERGPQGVKNYEFSKHMYILQYGARIKELRDAGYQIINKDDTFYLVPTEPTQVSIFDNLSFS